MPFSVSVSSRKKVYWQIFKADFTICLQSCILCGKSHCCMFTKLNITHLYGWFSLITPTRCDAAIHQHVLSCSNTLWINETSLILVKMSSKCKTQVALLLTELLTEIFIILYTDWSSYRWNFTNWHFRELSCVTNKITRGCYIWSFCSLFDMSTIKPQSKLWRRVWSYLNIFLTQVSWNLTQYLKPFHSIKYTQYAFEKDVIPTPAMHRTVYAGMFACILVAGKLQW